MKIALVNPRGTSTPELSIPHGLLQIGAELEAAVHEFKIVNYNDIDIPLNYEPLKSYDLVGLSVNTLQLAHAKKIAESIGDSTKIVWGGIHCLLDPESIMKSFPKHFLVKGEGEQPLLDIVRHLEGKESIDWLAARKGVCFTDKDRRIENDAFFNEDLNQLHDINYYRLDNLEKYLYSLKSSANCPSLPQGDVIGTVLFASTPCWLATEGRTGQSPSKKSDVKLSLL